MTLEPLQEESKVAGKRKTRQINRIKKLLDKVKRPHAFNEEKLKLKSRTQLTKTIDDLREELKKQ